MVINVKIINNIKINIIKIINLYQFKIQYIDKIFNI